MSVRVLSLADLKALKGQEIGASEWHLVTQEEVNKFAEATHDNQWIHVDPERAKQSPFGGTIAHGYYTLSIAPYLCGQIFSIKGLKMGLNYGLNKLRFPGPVKVGKRVRLRVSVMDCEDIPRGSQVSLGMTFEVEGEDKPAAVAEALYRYYE